MHPLFLILLLVPVASFIAGCGGEKKQPQASYESLSDEVAELNRKQIETSARIEELNQQIAIIRDLLEERRTTGQGKAGNATAKLAPTPKVVSAPAIKHEMPLPGQVRESSTEKPSIELYNQAFAQYQEGKFDQAIVTFDAFIRKNPQHEYAPNAMYWMGECYYDKGEHLLAIEQFTKVIRSFPGSAKTADALLKIGFSRLEMQDIPEGLAVLERVKKEHPTSAAAKKAAQKIKETAAP